MYGLSGFPINSSVEEVDVENALRQSITSDNMLGTSGLTVYSSTVSTQECKLNKIVPRCLECTSLLLPCIASCGF